MRYCSGRKGSEAQTENSRPCREVMRRERQEERRSASCSVSPAEGKRVRSWGWTHRCNLKQQRGFTRIEPFPLVPVHDDPVPGSAQHAAQLSDGERIGELTH